MRKSNSVLKIIAYAVIIIVLLLMIIATNTNRESTVGETVLSYTVMPIQRGFSYFINWISGYGEIFPQIETLKKDNEQLKEENDRLKDSVADYTMIYNENKMLKEQMTLQDKYPEFDTLVGTIIADNVNNWNKLIIVNQGSKDGVEVGMTVVSEKGLVGYVKEVSDSISKVLCLTDVGNSISCRLSKTKEAVVCKGELSLENESKLKLKYIPTDVELAVGDIVETSGIGGIYKKGITVGEIIEMHNSDNKLESYAIVKTAVDFSKLEYVLIVVE